MSNGRGVLCDDTDDREIVMVMVVNSRDYGNKDSNGNDDDDNGDNEMKMIMMMIMSAIMMTTIKR